MDVRAKRAELVWRARWGAAHEPQIHYTENGVPADGPTRQRWLALKLAGKPYAVLPNWTDCSGDVTWYYALCGLPDPNGLDYQYLGYTGTLLENARKHGRIYTDVSKGEAGDLIVIGPCTGDHVVMIVVPGKDPLVSSHGSEGGPVIQRLSVDPRTPKRVCQYLPPTPPKPKPKPPAPKPKPAPAPKPAPKPKPHPVQMVKLARFLKKAGIKHPWFTIGAARHAGLELAVLCAILEMETGGGINEFGHDKNEPFAGAGRVTRAKYLAYKKVRGPKGQGGMQGVGPMQLTYYAYQDAADKLGGCWKPRWNIQEGATILAQSLAKTHNLRETFRAWNGSYSYADEALKLVGKWRRVIQAV